jgi:hypothetical protein
MPPEEEAVPVLLSIMDAPFGKRSDCLRAYYYTESKSLLANASPIAYGKALEFLFVTPFLRFVGVLSFV